LSSMLWPAPEVVEAPLVPYRDVAGAVEAASSSLLRLRAEEVVALVQYFEVLPQRAALRLVRVGSLRLSRRISSLLRREKFFSSSSN
jgi:hypothetical protein